MAEAKSRDLVQLVGVGVLFAALGAGIGAWAWKIFQEKADDEERPPIIVMNGSIMFDAEYPTKKDKGTWDPLGQNQWRHKHEGKAPVRSRITVFNGDCGDGRRFASWEDGLILTYTDDSKTWEVEVQIAKNQLRVAAGDLKVTPTGSLLTLTLPDGYPPQPPTPPPTPPDPPKTRISRAVPLSGGAGCAFAATDQLVIRVEQVSKAKPE